MSMTLMAAAMNSKVGNPIRKLVLIKLADNANDKGECWPSYQHISDQCEITRRSVIGHIKALEDAGFVEIKRRKTGQKMNSSNVFLVRIPKPEIQGGSEPRSLGGSESHSLGSEPRSLGGSEPRSPRTSHSFEPVIEPKGKRKRFAVPTVSEVREYCRQRRNAIDPDAFVDFYESKGWMVGSSRMKDWKAAIRTWERKRSPNHGGESPGGFTGVEI